MKSAILALLGIIILSSISPRPEYIHPCSEKLEIRYYLNGKFLKKYIDDDGLIKTSGTIREIRHHELGRFMADSFVITQYLTPKKPTRIILSGKYMQIEEYKKLTN